MGTGLSDPGFAAALAEIGAAVEAIDAGQIDEACAMIADARRVVVYGCGREGLQLRGFAMRLYHMGLDVAVQGEMTAPPVGKADLLLVSAGPGELATVSALVGVARRAGAQVILLTAVPDAPASANADLVLVVPAQTMATDQGAEARSVLPMGSVYEGALFLLFEIMVLKLAQALHVRPEDMRARHTNLE